MGSQSFGWICSDICCWLSRHSFNLFSVIVSLCSKMDTVWKIGQDAVNRSTRGSEEGRDSLREARKGRGERGTVGKEGQGRGIYLGEDIQLTYDVLQGGRKASRH